MIELILIFWLFYFIFCWNEFGEIIVLWIQSRARIECECPNEGEAYPRNVDSNRVWDPSCSKRSIKKSTNKLKSNLKKRRALSTYADQMIPHDAGPKARIPLAQPIYEKSIIHAYVIHPTFYLHWANPLMAPSASNLGAQLFVRMVQLVNAVEWNKVLKVTAMIRPTHTQVFVPV